MNKNITQKHLQEFAQESSITFTGLIKQTYDDRKGLKQIIMQFEPIVNKIYAEVLGIQMQQIKDSLDDPQVNAREQVITLMIYIEEVLQEIEKHYQIPYNKQYFEDAFYEITIPEIVQEDAGAINNDGWCQNAPSHDVGSFSKIKSLYNHINKQLQYYYSHFISQCFIIHQINICLLL